MSSTYQVLFIHMCNFLFYREYKVLFIHICNFLFYRENNFSRLTPMLFFSVI